jgi:hypothetical protein
MGTSLGKSFRRLLMQLGLESRRRATQLSRRLHRAEERVALSRQVSERSRASMLRWKDKYRLRKQRAVSVTESLAELQELRHQVATLTNALRVSEDVRLTRSHEIDAFIAEAERELQDSRDQADAIEVKLDLVDGAINTLDRRYRTIVTREAQAGE